jgi:hypothetical protein
MLPDTIVAQCTGIILKVLALESNKTKKTRLVNSLVYEIFGK